MFMLQEMMEHQVLYKYTFLLPLKNKSPKIEVDCSELSELKFKIL
jgi:hypothetical protein